MSLPNKRCLYIRWPLFYKTVGLILLISLSLEMSVPSQGHYGVLFFGWWLILSVYIPVLMSSSKSKSDSHHAWLASVTVTLNPGFDRW